MYAHRKHLHSLIEEFKGNLFCSNLHCKWADRLMTEKLPVLHTRIRKHETVPSSVLTFPDSDRHTRQNSWNVSFLINFSAMLKSHTCWGLSRTAHAQTFCFVRMRNIGLTICACALLDQSAFVTQCSRKLTLICQTLKAERLCISAHPAKKVQCVSPVFRTKKVFWLTPTDTSR